METAQPSKISSARGAPLVIFVATRAEARSLCRALGPTHRSPHRLDAITRIGLDGRELLLARTGVGPDNAEAVARRLFSEGPVAAALSVGVAAGLNPLLHAGDLLVGDRAILHRGGGATSHSFSCDARLQEWALTLVRESGSRHSLGPIVTVERILLTAEEKHRVAAESGALAADMESAAIASAASARAVPFLAIRAILDPVEEDLKIAFDQFLDGMGEPRPLLLARHILTHPLTLPSLVGLGRRTSSLCADLGHLLRDLSTIPA